MLNFIVALLGIGLGLWTAKRRGGSRLDLLHYATIYGIIGFTLGSFAMLIIPSPI